MNELNWSSRVIATAVLGFLASFAWGCRAGRDPSADGGRSPTDGGTSPTADGGAPAGPATNCLAIRKCLYACADNKPCAERCVSTASAAALTPYRALQMCTRQQCPTGDEACRCDAECYSDGMCFELAVECATAESDPMCEELCH